MKETTLIGWHFAADTLRDGRPLPDKGERLTHNGPCVPCESGLHFSQTAWDALVYAPGFNVACVIGPANALPHGTPEDKRCGPWRENVTGYVDARAVIVAWAFAEADRAVRVIAPAALRLAAEANDVPADEREVLLAEATKLGALPVVDSRDTAEAASAAAWAAGDAGWAAGDAGWAASDVAWAARDAAGAARAAAGAARDAAGAARDAARAASAAGWAARDAGWAASAAGWAAGAAGWAASAAARAASAAARAVGNAAWAASRKESAERLEVALLKLFSERGA